MDRLISELVDDANELVWAGEDLRRRGRAVRASRPTRWPCWRWWPAKTSSRATGPASGGSRQRTAEDRVISIVDPESRHAHKTAHTYRDGYKAHVAVEPETGLVTDCDLTAGNAADAEAAAGPDRRRPRTPRGPRRQRLWQRRVPRPSRRPRTSRR